MAVQIIQIILGLLVGNKHEDAVIITLPTILNVSISSYFGLTFMP
jgi:hypothetical protein